MPYDAFEIGAAPGTSSIMNSISRSGGKPGTSWNTPKNSCTTGISLGSTPGVSIAFTAHKYAGHPVFNNLYAWVAEIRGTAYLELTPLWANLSPLGVTEVRIFRSRSMVALCLVIQSIPNVTLYHPLLNQWPQISKRKHEKDSITLILWTHQKPPLLPFMNK